MRPRIYFPSGLTSITIALFCVCFILLHIHSSNAQDTYFTDVTDQAGVYGDFEGARGVCWGDYNNDELLDVYVSSSYGENILYHNNGDGTFSDVTSEAGVVDSSASNGVAWGDYNNDSWLDLYVANFGINTLFRNNCDGTFTDVTFEAGVADSGGGEAVTWVDYDNDGQLDIYVVNLGGPNVLYRNLGDGIFGDASETSGLADYGTGENAAWADYDNDGLQDVYISNRYTNALYHNNGDGTFTDVRFEAAVADTGRGHGICWGDYNKDGWLDLYLVNRNTTNILYHNNGDGTFSDVTSEAGVGDEALYTVGTSFFDFDNDGDLDIYNTSGSINTMFSNNGDGSFTDVTSEAGVGDYGRLGNGMACGDYNSDGSVDIYVVNWTGGCALYRNNLAENNWIQLKLIGVESNRSAIGARIEVRTGEDTQILEINGGSGFCSQGSMISQFGLGENTMVDEILIKWPSGEMTVLEEIEANQLILVEETLTPPLPLEISVEPDTTYFQRGELMGFTVTVTNTTDSLIFFQGWTEGETPWGTVYSPLLGPLNAVLGTHQTVSSHLNQMIPNNAVFGGPYVYTVKVGQYPEEFLAQDSFEFFIVPGLMEQ